MSELANTLRAAREAKGLTISQVSEKTHIMSCVLEGLERDDFSRIPAAIYGRGFVRLICETVGIEDPKPLVNAFTSLYNGCGEPVPAAPQPAQGFIPQPTEAPVEVPPPPIVPEPVAPQPPPPTVSVIPAPSAAAAEPEFRLEGDSVPPPRPFDETPPAPPAPTLAPGANDLSGEPTSLSRYASPLQEYAHAHIPPVVWRMAVLAVIAAALLWLAWLGVTALYRATAAKDAGHVATNEAPVTEQAAEPPKEVSKTPQKAKPDPKASPEKKDTAPAKASTRVPQKVAPLYMD